MLHIDEHGEDGLFGLRKLKTVGYDGATGDGRLDLLGFDVEVVTKTRLRFWMVNNRSPVDENKKLLDPYKVGGNSTIDVFEVIRGSDEIVHLKSIARKAIISPNRVAAIGDGSILFTNDRTTKCRFLPGTQTIELTLVSLCSWPGPFFKANVHSLTEHCI